LSLCYFTKVKIVTKIAGLSSGEFVGMGADDPTNKIKLKTFHCEINNNHEELKGEADSYRQLPTVENVSSQMLNENFRAIKLVVAEIIENEIEQNLNTPNMEKISRN
jgi:hypothetical protein